LEREVSKVGKYFGIFIALSLAANTCVYAETFLDQVVVTPLKKPTRILNVFNNVQIITSKEIKLQGYESINEILSKSSSISIGSNGGYGQTKSIFLRGTESNHTKVLINGVDLNPGTLGVPSIQHISVDMIQRIEISKGSMSALYGKDTIGGVINIITKKNIGNKISISTGTHNTKNIVYSGGLNYMNHKFSTNINRLESDSFKAKVTSTEKHAYDTTNLDFNYVINIGQSEVSANYYKSTGNTEYDSFGSNLNQNHRDNHFKFNVNYMFADSYLDLFYVKKTNEINQAALSATDYTHTKINSFGFEYTIVGNESNHTLIGMDYNDEAMYELSYGTSFKHTNKIKQAYISSTHKISEKLQTNFGIRSQNHTTYDNFISGNVGINYYLNQSFVISSSLAKSFRAPDATDLFGYGGNSKLNPEESRASEISMRYKVSDNESFAGTLFHNKITNLIESDGTKMQNINKAKIYGIDISYEKYVNNKKLDIQYTYQEPKDQTNNVILSRRPRSRLIGNMTFFLKDAQSVGITTMYESRRDNSIYDANQLGSYVLVDANYTRDIQGYEVGFKINNLLDKSYRLAHNYNTDGRSFNLTIKSDF
tara:strand:- start:1532 stop:3319 length:1788 start_codon:yes stop_codon:yes gene_type:complete